MKWFRPQAPNVPPTVTAPALVKPKCYALRQLTQTHVAGTSVQRVVHSGYHVIQRITVYARRVMIIRRFRKN